MAYALRLGWIPSQPSTPRDWASHFPCLQTLAVGKSLHAQVLLEEELQKLRSLTALNVHDGIVTALDTLHLLDATVYQVLSLLDLPSLTSLKLGNTSHRGFGPARLLRVLPSCPKL
mmetsp:Transcript_34686/g.98285  ORF Transcript_34686/g.98285 Transcript_34686/m.98285 type:complete len:116 (+) Transcript_34686:214-561(+)